MPGDISFYYAIFKRLQATGTASNGHVNADNDPLGNYGGFSLKSAENANGLFGHLSGQPMMFPLKAGNFVPNENPVYVMLNTSLGMPPLPNTVTVGGQPWPVMPPPLNGDISMYQVWLDFNATSPRLIDALGSWISNGQKNDTPKDAPLTFAALSTAPAKFPLKANEYIPILFVASRPGDDGRRVGDHAMPNVPPVQVPANFWATSQIFLTYPPGVAGHPPGTIAHPAHLKSGEEYYVAAIIGNSGFGGAGRIFFNQAKIDVRCDALAFNTFLSPGTPLPSLGNLDPTISEPSYEQFSMRVETYDVAGFRFNVDKVFAGLKKAVTDQVPPAMLGGLSPEDWLKDGHPCVKVRIVGGEPSNEYLPSDNSMMVTLGSDPLKDRHIAQRNLAPFDMALMGLKKIQWKNFIVAQAGAGWNELTLQQALPTDAFRFYFAIPRLAWERFIDPKTSKGGVVRGLEVVREVPSKPFPDAVILRQTGPVHIRIAPHAHEKERFFGMSLGIEGDPAGFTRTRDSDVSVAHAAQDGGIVGGFTLQVPVVR